ncbi:MAG TPA: acyl-CoA dehydrogenase domain-containing protein, partial [Myxococcota bacterium]
SSLVKAYLTESLRAVVNDAMDIRAGAAIMRGPRNLLGRAYDAVPIGITVEGANILTRSMIIYGQGAIRCHPFVQREIEAAEQRDLVAFDAAFFGHVGFVFSSAARALLLGLTAGRIGGGHVGVPQVRRLVGRLSRLAAAFALVSDVCMATLGGKLKRREKITGRLADVLAWMYIASATLKRFCDEGERLEDRPLAVWATEHALRQAEAALAGILNNLPNRPAAWLLRPFVFPLGRREKGPSDALGSEVAEALLEDRAVRARLTHGIYLPPRDEPGLGRLEAALEKARRALEVEKRIRAAVRAGTLERRGPGESLAQEALQAGVISAEDLKLLDEADEARSEAVTVDAFTQEAYRGLRR